MLKLNDDKTEVVYIASPYFQKSMPSESLRIGDTAVSPARKARNIGVIFDETMSMKDHISSVCKTSHFHLRNIGAIRKYLTQDACATLVHSLVSSKLDYCNALLSKLPASSLNRLQRILNTAARLVSLQPKHVHIKPILCNLHWLPIEQRIKFKVLLFVFKCLNNFSPIYLSDLIKLHQPQRQLRSSTEMLLEYDTPSNKYGERAFSVYGPAEWNKLPLHVKSSESVASFKSNLKTFLFNEAFKDLC
jgi:hypothetical protein